MKKGLIKFSLASILMIGGLVGCNETDIPGGTIIDNGSGNKEKFTVTYNANGGTGEGLIDLNEYEAGSKVIVKENTFVAPEGLEFINWNEEADGSGSYHNAGSSFKIYENVTLYAQYLEKEDPINTNDPDAEHKITVNAPTGVSYTLSSTKAKSGTEVTLNITCDNGVSLNGNPTSSQVTITKKSDTSYSFVMPARAVTISIKALMTGEVVITGDINTKLTDDDHDGIYTAEVECSKTSYNFTYVVKDATGSPKRLSSMYLDETRCDAPVTFTSGDNELMITGGATYVFAYDSNAENYNCFITRKTVNVLPTTSKTLYTLFDGRMRSQSTVHPQGLTSIHYTKVVDGADANLEYKPTNEVYDYKKISNTESYAVSHNLLALEAKPEDEVVEYSYVYKNIDTVNNVYSIVNTYRKNQGNNEASDNVWGIDPYGYLQGERYFPYSAKQDIVANNLYRDTSRYQVTEREAYRNVNMAAHYGADLEYEIYKAIRGDFDGTATINAANADGSSQKITSEVVDGGFKVTVKSQLEYNHIATGSTADSTQEYAFVYNVVMNFKTNGDLVSMNYEEKYYSKANWNFSTHAPLSGGLPITTTINVTNGFNETFARSAVLGSFDPSVYFISSISKLSFYNEKCGDKSTTESVVNYDDKLVIYDYLGGNEPTKLVDEFEFSPATALDAWQYCYVNSSDKGVVDQTPYGPKAVGEGTATVTFGNGLKNISGATINVPVSVGASGDYHSLFVNATKTGYDSYNCDHADYIYGYAGKTMNYYIDASVNSGAPVSYWMVIKAKDEYGETYYTDSSIYFNVVNSVGVKEDTIRHLNYKKVVGNELILDFNTEAANALKSQVQIDVIFGSDYYTTGFGPSTLHIVIGPARTSIAGGKYSTTGTYSSDSTKKFDDAVLEFTTSTTGKITDTLYALDGSVLGTDVYNFKYTENNAGVITSCTITSVSMSNYSVSKGAPTTSYSYTLLIEVKQNGQVGVCLYTDDSDIFGSVDIDDEGFVEVLSLEGFTKVTA